MMTKEAKTFNFLSNSRRIRDLLFECYILIFLLIYWPIYLFIYAFYDI